MRVWPFRELSSQSFPIKGRAMSLTLSPPQRRVHFQCFFFRLTGQEWSHYILRFCWKSQEFWGVLIFAPIRASSSLEIQSTLLPSPTPPGRGYLPVLGIQIIEKPEKFESRSCCHPDKIVIEKKYNKCKLSIDHSHLLGKIKGLQTNKVISNNQHNYKKMKCPGLRSEHINV